MLQVIIYKTDVGGVAIAYPTPNDLAKYGIEAIALKDVPFGKPYKIIDSSELPSRENRTQWDVDDADLTDGVGADYGKGSLWEVVNMNPLTVRHAETGEIKEVAK